MRFLDTNVLLYAVSRLPEEEHKRTLARELLSGRDLCLSAQVLQEFYYQATHPRRRGRMVHEDAMEFVQPLMLLPVQPVTLDLFQAAAAISHRYRLSYWDGAILAAARALGCDAVYSEDLSSEQDYGGLRVIDPFVGGRRTA